MQLLRVEEPENERAGLGGVWIGAHPTIGEKLAQARYLVITPMPHPTDRQIDNQKDSHASSLQP